MGWSRNSVEPWMKERKVISIRAFSETDACELPHGWEKPSEFNLDMIVIKDGAEYVIFTEDAYQVHPVRPVDEFKEYYDGLEEGTTIVGYGSSKWDLPLIFSKTDTSLREDLFYYDLMDEVHDATAEHYDSYGRRIPLSGLATINKTHQHIIPFLDVITKPLKLISEWRHGNRSKVIKNLMADTDMIAKLVWTIEKEESLKIRDDRTDKLVRINLPWHHSNTSSEDPVETSE